MNQKSDKRGGKRQGAGRKPNEGDKMIGITIMLSPEVKQSVKKKYGPKIQDMARDWFNSIL